MGSTSSAIVSDSFINGGGANTGINVDEGAVTVSGTQIHDTAMGAHLHDAATSYIAYLVLPLVVFVKML